MRTTLPVFATIATAQQEFTPPAGKGRFDDVMSEADAHALHPYLIDQAWRMQESTSIPTR
jgi:hypothetical protein